MIKVVSLILLFMHGVHKAKLFQKFSLNLACEHFIIYIVIQIISLLMTSCLYMKMSVGLIIYVGALVLSSLVLF